MADEDRSYDYLFHKLDRAFEEVMENRRRLEVHLTECSTRFAQIQFWARLATIALFVLFCAEFLHLDAEALIRLVAPAIAK